MFYSMNKEYLYERCLQILILNTVDILADYHKTNIDVRGHWLL